MTISMLLLVGALTTTQTPGAAPPALEAQEAREAQLAAAVARRPSDFAPYQALARLYMMTGRRDEADKVLRQALAVHANSGAVFAALVELHSNPRNPEQLIAIAEEWTRADPTNPQPLTVAARAHSDFAKAATTEAERNKHMERAKRAIEELAVLMEAKGTGATRAVVQSGSVRTSTSAAFPDAVRVGGNVRTPRKIKDARPEMPQGAVDANVQGVVILEIVIDATGTVAEARVLRSIPLLDQAAVDAVKQWQFEPTQLEGKAVPVIMTVTVQFSRRTP